MKALQKNQGLASTAKMGRDELSVVDAKLRVYGVQHLRVADASIMPMITTGNTQAPCVVIGERMAEILNVARVNTQIKNQNK